MNPADLPGGWSPPVSVRVLALKFVSKAGGQSAPNLHLHTQFTSEMWFLLT